MTAAYVDPPDDSPAPETSIESGQDPAETAGDGGRPSSVADEIRSILEEDSARDARDALQGQTAATVYVPAWQFNIEHLHGGVAGRDFVSSRPDDKTSHGGTSRVLRNEMSKTYRVYTETPAHPAAAESLADHRLVVLAGPPHQGKWMAALRLVGAARGNDVFQMPLDTDIVRLESFEFASDTGYVIDTLAPAEAERLSRDLLHDLEIRLKEASSDLVITVDSRAARITDLGHYCVRWEEPPDRFETFRRHLSWYADAERAEFLLEAVQQDERVAEALRGCANPPEIDRLAGRLARMDAASDDISEVLRTLIPKGVEEWFASHEDPRECCHMIAFAVLSGASYSVASELGADLTKRMDVALDTSPEDAVPSPFSLRRTKLLASTLARVVPGYEDTAYGPAPVELIHVDESIHRPAVLRLAWQEFDAVRRPLVGWLHDLGSHPSRSVRERAAAAVGELSKYAFREIHSSIVQPWASSDSRKVREAAALALGVPAWESTSAPQVVRVLHHWAAFESNPHLQLTAVAAFGGLVGLRFPDIALGELRRIVVESDPRLFRAVAHAVTTLFEAGGRAPEYYDEVLGALVDWSGDARSVESLAALMIFLGIASGSRAEPSSKSVRWPTLLWLASSEEGRFDKVVELWRRALNERLLRQEALERLRRWVEEADEAPHLQGSVQRLVGRLAEGSERERDRLCHHLRTWAETAESSSATAAECLSVTG